MAKVRFYLLDITYKIKDGKPVIWMFGRTEDGKKVCVTDESFMPYFYVLAEGSIKDKILRITASSRNSEYKTTGIEEKQMKVSGKEEDVLKVYVDTPKGVPAIKEEVMKLKCVRACYEYDLNYVRRYLIDRDITPFTLIEAECEVSSEKARVPVLSASKICQYNDASLANPKIVSIDIETYNPKGREMNADENPIIMAALYSENFNRVITWKSFQKPDEGTEFVKSEAELIERIKEEIIRLEPDIITGYFTDGFDFPYIAARAKKYRIKLDIGIDYSELEISGREKTQASISGIVHLDAFKMALKVLGRVSELGSFDLGTVAQYAVGETKLDVDVSRLAEFWDRNSEEIRDFCRYNLQDARVTYKLFLKLYPTILELVRTVGLPAFDVPRMGFSQLVEWFIIRQAAEYKEIVPEKPDYREVKRRKSMSYEGAFVFEPKPGIYKNIAVFDFRSLYPTIIASHNISPATLNCKCCRKKGEKYWFCEKKKGFIPTIIEEIITRRTRIKQMISKEKKKDPLLKAREQSLKLLANSFYGYLGFFNARWYSFESAESTTAFGRKHIKEVISEAGKKGFEVIYSDTDSVMMLLGEKSDEDALDFAKQINRELPGVMELEFEGLYSSGIFVSAKGSEAGAKKKYALLNSKGEIEIKGFETVRRNWSFIAKEIQKKVLEILLKENNSKQAFDYIMDMISMIRKNQIDKEKMVIHTQLQKGTEDYASVGPHVAAAKLMEKKGIDVGPGSIIKFIVAKGEGRIRDKVMLPEDANQSDYDPEYYINSQVIPSIERIMEPFGYSKDDFQDKKGQKKLGEF